MPQFVRRQEEEGPSDLPLRVFIHSLRLFRRHTHLQGPRADFPWCYYSRMIFLTLSQELSLAFHDFRSRDAVRHHTRKGPSDPPNESPQTFSHLVRRLECFQAPGRACLLVFSPRAPADCVAGTSLDVHDSGLGIHWSILTPQLALLQIPAGLPYGLSPSSCFHSLAAFSSSLQPTFLGSFVDG